MSDDEKSYALNRLRKLILPVEMPDELVDYSTLVLSPTDYHGNTRTIDHRINARVLLFANRSPVRKQTIECARTIRAQVTHYHLALSRSLGNL
jgi:phosphatidylserine decarboxylase